VVRGGDGEEQAGGGGGVAKEQVEATDEAEAKKKHLGAADLAWS
jgi:hypothetical protein